MNETIVSSPMSMSNTTNSDLLDAELPDTIPADALLNAMHAALALLLEIFVGYLMRRFGKSNQLLDLFIIQNKTQIQIHLPLVSFVRLLVLFVDAFLQECLTMPPFRR